MSDDQPLTNGRNLVYFSRLVRVIPPTAVLPEYVLDSAEPSICGNNPGRAKEITP
jgi:hypothetical protein